MLRYKLRWVKKHNKLPRGSVLVDSKIYKEMMVNNNNFVIVKGIENNQTIYLCRVFDKDWITFGKVKNPREAINTIKNKCKG